MELTRTATLTIPKSSHTSGIHQISESIHIGMLFPASFTGDTVSFQAAEKRDGTFGAVYADGNTLVTVTVQASAWVTLPDELRPYHSIKVIASSSQAAARTLTLSHKAT